jgi:hypothetical protein
MGKSIMVNLNQLLFRRNYKMKRKALATTAIGLLAFGASATGVFAEDDLSHSISADTNVTLKKGSGEDATPIVPDDTHDNDPSTGDKGALTIPFASNITFGEQEIKQGDADYYALNKKPHVQVNDTRGGTKGWKLSVSISAFTGENGQFLRGAKLILSGGKAVTKNNNSLPPKIVNDVLVLNKEAQDLMLAKFGQGAGAFAAVFEGKDGQNKNVRLHVPSAGMEAQRYTAKLTWVLSDAPA